MIELSEARARVLSSLPLLGLETVSIADASGRVTATHVIARMSNPPADVSAMDGYAVRAADALAGSVLRVVAEAPAGHPTSTKVGPGECVRLFTGSVIPSGADAVLIQENVSREENSITVNAEPRSGAFIRPQGQDFAKGQVVVPAGRRMTARDVGVAAAANVPWVTVRRRPRVAIVSTGDEIALPGEPVPPGGIIGSVAPMLAALLREAGAEPVMIPPARDTVEDIRRATQGLESHDLVLTVGGASVGAYDLVKDALGQSGLNVDFWKIAMRPGKPLMFGRLRGTPVIGLPGNPVAAFVCSVVFALPALRSMSGQSVIEELPHKARLAIDLDANDSRFDHLRATLSRDEEGVLWATPFAKQDSGMLAPLAACDALVLRPAHAPAANRGEVCDIIRFGRMSD
ncbi:molybdopterin biosynthesis protein MoeA [Acetobacter nitrogenifigens DSM 23921 = NBRC 105050]|uniref:Molybdopterin molybdenumtransferase n=1 Tax=Acetobacter nitrogenifigens DSM 23921 = NBRC 105050 TaxID=1120919 RepID=A0A511X9W6_9PROT|nr:gephyrin-like molybdotransferase Glp [Acetobacter nitrogenifigens]GBQ98022.1 molybdopterin biosynthesis protein MoeA [Acetobacter nitrogenifigens DSM 23921 = NBRC 105050]GEN59722.1 molybdopterin molybdenumtransferase MoeA [Acetobacter nitrogenifigens DSM 23921 = NBRC 105050]